MKRTNSIAKRIAISASLTALICVILALGAVFEALDLTFAVISSLIIWISLLEFGKKTAWGIYFPSAVIATLLLPSKFPALFFTAVTGWYPMFRLLLIKKIKSKWLSYAVKLIVFNIVTAALTAFIYFFGASLGLAFEDTVTKAYLVLMFVFCNISFIITDILMDKLVIIYIVKMREKLIKLGIINRK